MEKIFDKAKDKNVAAVKIYANSGSYYYDADHTKEVDDADMFDHFCKGVICESEGVWYKPISCTEAGVIDFGL